MANLSDWVQEIMSQKFLDSDATRLILLESLYANGAFQKVYLKNEILEYIYRVYSDYPECSQANPYPKIKNISYYGVSDIKPVLDKALETWRVYATNQILVFDERHIYLDLDNSDLISAVQPVKMVVEMYKNKYFNFRFFEPLPILLSDCIDDSNIDVFGMGLFKNRVLEDMQYCPICEETRKDELVAVHIVPARFCEKSEDIIDKNNGLIFCREHATDYLQNRFIFKSNGFVEIIEECSVPRTAHLSISIKNQKRRRFLEQVEKISRK